MGIIFISDHFILNILPTFKHLSVQWKVWIHPVKTLFLDHAGSNCSKNQWCRKSIKGLMLFLFCLNDGNLPHHRLSRVSLREKFDWKFESTPYSLFRIDICINTFTNTKIKTTFICVRLRVHDYLNISNLTLHITDT